MVIFTRGGNEFYFDSEVFIFDAGNLRNVWEVRKRNEYYCYKITDGHNVSGICVRPGLRTQW